MTDSTFQKALLERLDQLLSHLDTPSVESANRPAIDWAAPAFLWRHGPHAETGHLQPVPIPHVLNLDSLLNIDRVKTIMQRNTLQFLRGAPANNALLWGSRGTGKSSLIKALLNEYHAQGLRVIELEGHLLADLPDIIELIKSRPERFIIFADDLSFERDDASYKALKSVLDGSLAHRPDNLLIYATSNRRNLMPGFFSENREFAQVDGEIHPGESVEEKVSLSERFGLWLSFHPFTQNDYLAVVDQELKKYQLADTHNSPETRNEAIKWATQRGSRSGRVAEQFVRDWLGRHNPSGQLNRPAPDIAE